MQVYRFRIMKYLLEDEYQELKKREIYFPRLEQLNDPMEGFRDIFWRGDKIVWENFFKHYVFCLYTTHLHFLIAGHSIQLNANNIPILVRWDKLPFPAQRMFNEVWQRFLDLPKIPEFIEALENTNRKIRYRELRGYLGSIHSALFYEIAEVFFANGLMPRSAIRCPSEGLPPVGKRLVSTLKAMTQLEEDEETTNALLQVDEAEHYKLRIEFQLNNVILTGISERNFLLVHFDFPSVYLKEIEKLLYSNWRTACFTDNYHNFSMWDSYGDNHKGACLIFESAQIAGSRQYRGVSGLYKVVYGAKLNEVDFFRSIGAATVGQLKELWYTDAEGNFSECGDHIPRDGERDNDDTVLWRKNYWDNFYRNITSKTKYWEHEREWRLVLEDRWLDEAEDPKLIYDFNSLKGIIFGIRSSDEEILKAIKIIQKKCEKHERTDFKFYKAEYSQKTGEIRKNEILLPKALQNVR